MIENDIHKTALDALRTRTLIRLPHIGGDASRVRTQAAPGPQSERSDAIARLVDSVWETEGEGRFDGVLMGVTGAATTDDEVTLICRPIRYRDYVATDRVLDTHPDSSFPLAVGVHAILSCSKGIICLRLDNGRIALPGGAVDAQDLMRTSGDGLVQAVSREVSEETGIDLEGRPIQTTGLYVGGYPTHILAMFYADLGDAEAERTISSFRPSDTLDQVRSIELRSLGDLIETMTDLPLVMRAALRSLRHWRGDEPASTITT